MKHLSVLLLLFFGSSVLAQKNDASDFVIDKSKPFVYLRFDHIGPRKPLQDGEGAVGLWLRVVNNCRIPISFLSNSAPIGEPGVMLMDEVVDTESMMQITSTPEEEAEIQRHEKARLLKHKPTGYSAEVSGVVRVQPGAEILFSVPLNHVDEDWYLRVKFALDVSKSSVAVGPFTYLPFYEWDIPKEFRQINR
jgi:hypothetical protein